MGNSPRDSFQCGRTPRFFENLDHELFRRQAHRKQPIELVSERIEARSAPSRATHHRPASDGKHVATRCRHELLKATYLIIDFGSRGELAERSSPRRYRERRVRLSELPTGPPSGVSSQLAPLVLAARNDSNCTLFEQGPDRTGSVKTVGWCSNADQPPSVASPDNHRSRTIWVIRDPALP